MPGLFPHFQGSPDQDDDRLQHARSIDRSFSKQLFREMAKTEMEDAPLTGRQQRQFVAFATRLGIDEFEARLILRAVEYECGHAELAALDERNDHALSMTQFVYSDLSRNQAYFDLVKVLMVCIAAIAICRWCASAFLGG